MWGDWSHVGWGWIGLGAVHMLLFWVLIILLIVALVRWLSNPGDERSSLPPKATALDILKERYARGEIERDEFEAKKRDLQRG